MFILFVHSVCVSVTNVNEGELKKQCYGLFKGVS